MPGLFPVHGARHPPQVSRCGGPTAQLDTAPHPGHAAGQPRVLAWTRTGLPAAKPCSTTTSAGYRSRTSA